jgi:hypothetical protein
MPIPTALRFLAIGQQGVLPTVVSPGAIWTEIEPGQADALVERESLDRVRGHREHSSIRSPPLLLEIILLSNSDIPERLPFQGNKQSPRGLRLHCNEQFRWFPTQASRATTFVENSRNGILCTLDTAL